MELGTDKRKHRRFEMAFPLRVRVKSEVAAEIETSTRDISGRGIYFTLPREVTPGSEFECEFTLPPEFSWREAVRVRGRGTIVRVDRHDGGIGVAATLKHYEFVRSS